MDQDFQIFQTGVVIRENVRRPTPAIPIRKKLVQSAYSLLANQSVFLFVSLKLTLDPPLNRG
jgi:hypothetical protein